MLNKKKILVFILNVVSILFILLFICLLGVFLLKKSNTYGDSGMINFFVYLLACTPLFIWLKFFSLYMFISYLNKGIPIGKLRKLFLISNCIFSVGFIYVFSFIGLMLFQNNPGLLFLILIILFIISSINSLKYFSGFIEMIRTLKFYTNVNYFIYILIPFIPIFIDRSDYIRFTILLLTTAIPFYLNFLIKKFLNNPENKLLVRKVRMLFIIFSILYLFIPFAFF